MADTMYDVIVVGAGVEGSGTAWQLSRRGAKVLLLEQQALWWLWDTAWNMNLDKTIQLPPKRFEPISSRIKVETNFDKLTSVKTPLRMHWESDFVQLLAILHERNIGYMKIGNLSDKELQDDMASMKSNNAPYKIITPEEFRQRFPNTNYDKDVGAVHDLEGGILYADKCVRALQGLFVSNGGVLKDGEKVETIIPGDVISVVTPNQTYTGRSLVVCCGAWTNKVLNSLQLQLPLVPEKISACYWPEKVPGSYSVGNMMAFSEKMKRSVTHPFDTYGLPSNEYPGHFKFCLHSGSEADPDKRDFADNQWAINLLKIYVRKHFPGLIPEPSVIESCFYTMTPDKDFILDLHPQWKNIAIGAGFSGHGFKHGPAVGDILADLALGRKPKYDISRLKIGRFDTARKSKL